MEAPEVLPSVGMKGWSLFLAASVTAAGVAIAVAPSARADCIDGDKKYSANAALWYTCIGGEFREGGTLPPTFHGPPCAEGSTFTSLGASPYTYKCVGGRYCVVAPNPGPYGPPGRRCP